MTVGEGQAWEVRKGIKPVDPVCSLPLLCRQVFSFETAPSPPTRSVPAPRAGSAGTRSVQSVLVQPRPQAHTHNPPTHLMLKVSSRQPSVWSLGVRVTPQPAPPLPCPAPHTLPRPPSYPQARLGLQPSLVPSGAPCGCPPCLCFSRDTRGQDRPAYADSG